MIIIFGNDRGNDKVIQLDEELTEFEIFDGYNKFLADKMLEAKLITTSSNSAILSHVQSDGVKLNRHHIKASRKIISEYDMTKYLLTIYSGKIIDNWIELESN